MPAARRLPCPLVERDDRREEELEPAALAPVGSVEALDPEVGDDDAVGHGGEVLAGDGLAAGQFVPDLDRTLDAEIEARGEVASEQLLLPLPPAFADRVASVERLSRLGAQEGVEFGQTLRGDQGVERTAGMGGCAVKSASCAAAASS